MNLSQKYEYQYKGQNYMSVINIAELVRHQSDRKHWYIRMVRLDVHLEPVYVVLPGASWCRLTWSQFISSYLEPVDVVLRGAGELHVLVHAGGGSAGTSFRLNLIISYLWYDHLVSLIWSSRLYKMIISSQMYDHLVSTSHKATLPFLESVLTAQAG